MAGISSSRADRLIGRLPRPALLPSIELLLLALIAMQAARLAWTLIAPLGPVGAWQAASMVAQPPSSSVAGAFDPFFRLSGAAGPVTVTALDLTLFGVREDKATGRGSAIIRLPDGLQGSFAVGEEILPGVILTAVEFDSVTISRNGAQEQIFLDQSPPAPAVGGEGAAAVPAVPQAAAPAPESAARQIQFQPRTANGQVTGIIVQPSGSGDAFRAAGFAPGDVIVSIDNQRITSADQARLLAGRSGGEVSILVERGGRAIPLRVRLNP